MSLQSTQHKHIPQMVSSMVLKSFCEVYGPVHGTLRALFSGPFFCRVLTRHTSSMWAIFKGAATALAESVAPLIRTNLEQLNATWKKINEEYARMLQSTDDALDDATLVERSRLPELFGQLINVLVTEDNEVRAAAAAANASVASSTSAFGAFSVTMAKVGADTDHAAPCLEYFVHETLLDRIVALGLADRPPGMRRLIAKTLTALFTHLRHGQLLPHASIQHSLLQFLSVSVARGDMQSQNKAARTALVSLLRTLCMRLRDDPSLYLIFLRENTDTKAPEFLPFTALLQLLNAEHDDGDAARDGMLYCLQLPVEQVSQFIVSHTLFCEQLVFGVRERYEKLPRSVEELENPSSQTQAAMESFLTWLDLVNMAVQSTFKFVGDKLIAVLLRDFLLPCVQSGLLDSGKNAVLATSFVRRLVERWTAPALRSALINFLLGNERHEERFSESLEDDDAPASAAERVAATSLQLSMGIASQSHALRRTLILRINDVDDDLALATLHLFDSLLLTRDPEVYYNLLLRTLLSCRFTPNQKLRTALRDQREITHVRIADIMAPFPSLKAICKFQLLEAYLVDAQTEGQEWVQEWSTWLKSHYATLPVPSIDIADVKTDGTDGKPAEEVSAEAENEDDIDEESHLGPFYPGLFVSNLFDRLQNLYSNPFPINLALTGVLAKLCYSPHPIAHAFLLDPALSTRSPPQQLTLFRILAKLYATGQTRAAQMAAYAQRMDDTRRKLNNEGDMHDGVVPVAESLSVELFLQGQIVFEEFIKELLAISQAKSNLTFAASKLQQQQELHAQQQKQAAAASAAAAEASAATYTETPAEAPSNEKVDVSASVEQPAATEDSAVTDVPPSQ